LNVKAQPLQFGPQLAEVVDLAITDQPQAVVGVGDGLVTTARSMMDRRRIAMPQEPAGVLPFIVRTPVDRPVPMAVSMAGSTRCPSNR
jgi:hypothetical protein